MRHLRKVVAIKPETRNAWLRLGLSFEAQRRFVDAAKAYRELLKQWPADSEAYTLLGRALRSFSKEEEARSAF